MRRRFPDLRWVAPANLHLTLAFLGSVTSEQATHCVASATGAGLGPAFALGLAGIGTFPERGRPRVLWLGVGEGGAATTLVAASLARIAAAEGIAVDPADRFHPHVTIARIAARPPADLRAALGELAGFRIPAFPVTVATLYESRAGRGGSVYEARASIRLHGSGLLDRDAPAL